jgi:EAL domain-containing protein (putative c-di-GMP-specific phosphodiesterase class I)
VRDLERALREHEEVAAALSRLHAQGTPVETALAVCHELAGLAGVDSVSIAQIRADGSVMPLAGIIPPSRPLLGVPAYPPERAEYLRARARGGPWIEEQHATNGSLSEYELHFLERGLTTAAYIPVADRDRLQAILVVRSGRPHPMECLAELLPTLVQFGAMTGAILVPELVAERASAGERRRLKEIVDGSAFDPVFQRVVRLADEVVVGYEALTRFRDGSPPEVQFAAAQNAGLEIELDQACMRRAVERSGFLPEPAWLAVNASPGALLSGSDLAGILRMTHRRLVLEVTERTPVADYEALRDSLSRLPVPADLAIDDAGAGFASLRHIIELRPRYVKLHMGLVRDIHTDPLRQALVAGMVHFTGRIGCHLVAEGIEQEAERDELRSLGVGFGQGYFFGPMESPPSA